MSYWDGKAIIEYPAEPYFNHPGWLRIDCGCCNGIEWGGNYPVECKRCGGGGFLAKHIPTGVVAEYPGGRFR